MLTMSLEVALTSLRMWFDSLELGRETVWATENKKKIKNHYIRVSTIKGWQSCLLHPAIENFSSIPWTRPLFVYSSKKCALITIFKLILWIQDTILILTLL